jgi:hypothetical protein
MGRTYPENFIVQAILEIPLSHKKEKLIKLSSENIVHYSANLNNLVALIYFLLIDLIKVILL